MFRRCSVKPYLCLSTGWFWKARDPDHLILARERQRLVAASCLSNARNMAPRSKRYRGRRSPADAFQEMPRNEGRFVHRRRQVGPNRLAAGW